MPVGLQRLGELSTDELCNVTNSDDDLPRIHAQRLLAARGELSDELDTAMVAGLRDANPFVKRAAAAALARHPRKSHARPILDAMINLPAGDVHLRHQLKIALRNQLEMGGTLPELLKSADESDKALLAEICLGLDGTDATAFLLEMLQDPDFEPDQPQQVIQRLARWATPVASARATRSS